MEISHRTLEQVLVIVPNVEHLDANNTNDLKHQVSELIEQNAATCVVLDLREVQFVDSSGIGSLISLLRTIKSNNGQIALAGVTRTVQSVFEIVRLHKLFDIYDNVDEAVKALA